MSVYVLYRSFFWGGLQILRQWAQQKLVSTSTRYYERRPASRLFNPPRCIIIASSRQWGQKSGVRRGEDSQLLSCWQGLCYKRGEGGHKNGQNRRRDRYLGPPFFVLLDNEMSTGKASFLVDRMELIIFFKIVGAKSRRQRDAIT